MSEVLNDHKNRRNLSGFKFDAPKTKRISAIFPEAIKHYVLNPNTDIDIDGN